MKILIVSTEKTGNTWLKLLLAGIYDLPVPSAALDFSIIAGDALGAHWVTHQHYMPEQPLLDWTAANEVICLTTIRHPGDVLVSLYHYCCNYPHHYTNDAAIMSAMAADAPAREASGAVEHHVVDGKLIRTLQDRLICDLNISISWMRSGRSRIVRFEDLRSDPFRALTNLTAQIAPAAPDRIQRAIARCDLAVLQQTQEMDRKFYRRALPGEWRSVLPADVRRRFREEEPLRSQCAFLGYDFASDQAEPSLTNWRLTTEPDKPVALAKVLRLLFDTLPAQTRERWKSSDDQFVSRPFFEWANAPAEEEQRDAARLPRISNLAAYIYQHRPDLQREFPDLFGANRLGYAMWFLRYAAHAYQLDRRFLTPIALSFLEAN